MMDAREGTTRFHTTSSSIGERLDQSRVDADKKLYHITQDVFVLITIFLNDQELARLLQCCRLLRSVGTIEALWKKRLESAFSALLHPVLLSPMRRDCSVRAADVVVEACASYRERYLRMRSLYPSGLSVSSNIFEWFDPTGVNVPPLQRVEHVENSNNAVESWRSADVATSSPARVLFRNILGRFFINSSNHLAALAASLHTQTNDTRDEAAYEGDNDIESVEPPPTGFDVVEMQNDGDDSNYDEDVEVIQDDDDDDEDEEYEIVEDMDIIEADVDADGEANSDETDANGAGVNLDCYRSSSMLNLVSSVDAAREPQTLNALLSSQVGTFFPSPSRPGNVPLADAVVVGDIEGDNAAVNGNESDIETEGSTSNGAVSHQATEQGHMRLHPPLFEPLHDSNFLQGNMLSVLHLSPSLEGARAWARRNGKNPVRKLARFHRWGMFWLQLEHDDLSFRANRPFVQPVSPGSPSISYFECTVLRQPNAVGIGIVDQVFQACAPGVFVGWPSSGSSYGYHGDDGLKFHNDGRGQEYSVPYGAGDVVGCGIDWRSGSLFFTCNGNFKGVAFENVDVSESARWYPTVSLKHVLSRRSIIHAGADDHHEGTIREDNDEYTDAVCVNLGTNGQRFLFDLSKLPHALHRDTPPVMVASPIPNVDDTI